MGLWFGFSFQQNNTKQVRTQFPEIVWRICFLFLFACSTFLSSELSKWRTKQNEGSLHLKMLTTKPFNIRIQFFLWAVSFGQSLRQSFQRHCYLKLIELVVKYNPIQTYFCPKKYNWYILFFNKTLHLMWNIIWNREIGSSHFNRGYTELWGILTPSYLWTVFITSLLKLILKYINHLLGTIHTRKINKYKFKKHK